MNELTPWALLGILTLMSCGPTTLGPAGANCARVSLETRPSSLPLSTPVAVDAQAFRWSEPFVVGTPELACCVTNPGSLAKADCPQVDCQALRRRLTSAGFEAGSPYANEPCGNSGAGNCTVFLDGDAIVGVLATCND